MTTILRTVLIVAALIITALIAWMIARNNAPILGNGVYFLFREGCVC